MDALLTFLSSQSFMPHGHCFLWRPSLLWLYILSDLSIGLAYYSIPLALVYFVRKRKDLEYHWIFNLFSLFIFACGTTHLISIWTLWNPDYWLDGTVKGITALVSVITAVLLWRLIPEALNLPSPEQLRLIIVQKEREVAERRQIEVKLADLNETLELRVARRTAELEETNRLLEAEIELRKAAEDRFRRAVEYAPNGMIMTSSEGMIELVNKQTEQVFGYSRLELLGQSIEMLVPAQFKAHHPDLRRSFFKKPNSRPMGEGRDLNGLRKDGSEVPIEIALNPIPTESDIKVLAAIVDISDRKQKENAIQASLREKTTLLAEVHHRVKNNLQLIQSLLDLQASQTGDERVVEILSNSIHRIRSMSIIHQALYQSDTFAEVELSEVLHNLIDVIAASYNVNNQKINLSVDVETVTMPLTQAIPCGLIVNELMTNVYKYAFPDGRDGYVSVQLVLQAENRAKLTITDNGIGLSPEVNLDSLSTLGLELVSVLTDQIDGTLTINRCNPTQFVVEFNI